MMKQRIQHELLLLLLFFKFNFYNEEKTRIQFLKFIIKI